MPSNRTRRGRSVRQRRRVSQEPKVKLPRLDTDSIGAEIASEAAAKAATEIATGISTEVNVPSILTSTSPPPSPKNYVPVSFKDCLNDCFQEYHQQMYHPGNANRLECDCQKVLYKLGVLIKRVLSAGKDFNHKMDEYSKMERVRNVICNQLEEFEKFNSTTPNTQPETMADTLIKLEVLEKKILANEKETEGLMRVINTGMRAIHDAKHMFEKVCSKRKIKTFQLNIHTFLESIKSEHEMTVEVINKDIKREDKNETGICSKNI